MILCSQTRPIDVKRMLNGDHLLSVFSIEPSAIIRHNRSYNRIMDLRRTLNRDIKHTQGPSSHYNLAAKEKFQGTDVGDRLGKGRTATVYKYGQVHAIKIYRSSSLDQRYFRNEVRILNLLFVDHLAADVKGPPPSKKELAEARCPHLVEYFGSFVKIGYTSDFSPRLYPCIVFALKGDTIAHLLKEYGALDLATSCKITEHTFRALDYLHSRGIIHTDVKPENLLMNKSIEEITSGSRQSKTASARHNLTLPLCIFDDLVISLGDLGSSTLESDVTCHTIGTDPYLAPEVVADIPEHTTAVDIWSASTLLFEYLTDEPLFDARGDGHIKYSFDADGDCIMATALDNIKDGRSSTDIKDGGGCESKDGSCGCSCDESSYEGSSSGLNSTSENATSESESSSSGDSGDRDMVNHRYFSLFIHMLGPIPEKYSKLPASSTSSVSASAPISPSTSGEVATTKEERRGGYQIENGLKNNVEMTNLLAQYSTLDPSHFPKVVDFMSMGLQYLPADRKSAREILAHPLLAPPKPKTTARSKPIAIPSKMKKK